jgi:DNA-binding transcriptional MocR family regulator/dihydrodipicolinate reductase
MPKYGQYDVPNYENMVNFGTGQPNNLNLPMEWFQNVCLKMATDKFGSNENEHKQLLQYGAIEGYLDIRKKIADWLTTKYYKNLLTCDLPIKYEITPQQIFMTNGNTGALHTLISKYCESGDSIIVENPTYFIAINIFNEYGLTVEGVDMEPDGVDLDMLENKIQQLNKDEKTKQSVLFYYMIPTHHNPTGITTTHEKRKKIAKLCQKYTNFYVIADEVYHFLTFSEKYNFYPMADYHPKMISLGSFSKILAPALRVGWIYQNTSHKNYDDNYGFVTGDSGLNKSSVLDSSGGINPIGFKFVEYALDDSEGERPIDQIITSHLSYLEANCQIMMDYLSQFNNVEFFKPNGGYFLWLSFKTVNNTTNFLKLCERNKVKFHPGIKFSTDSDFTNSVRLSFSYYKPNELVAGLERIMDCVLKFNLINVKLLGSSGKLGSLIKKEILSNKDINYLGDIKRDFTISDIQELDPYNSVIVDVSSDMGTHSLLSTLIKAKNYVPVITGTTGLSADTNKLINLYANYAPIAHITNFSEGIPLFRNFAKLSNILTPEWQFSMTDIHHVHKKDAPSGTAKTIKSEINRDVQIESIRTGEIIGEHTLKISNGSETITITHSVADRNTFAKGCINYIYWILTKNNGLYNKIDNDVEISIYPQKTEVIGVTTMNKVFTDIITKHLVQKIKCTYSNLTKLVLLNEIEDGKYNGNIYDLKNDIKKMDYCGYSLMAVAKYLKENNDLNSSTIVIDDNDYIVCDDDKHVMVSLPIVTYQKNNTVKDNSISEIISQMTILLLYGIGRYSSDNNNYLILEIKENILHSDMLGTIATIINSEQPSDNKFTIIFINPIYSTLNKNGVFIRMFDPINNEEIYNDSIGFSAVLEYYMFHFVKKYDEPKNVEIKMSNDMTILMSYNNTNVYMYDVSV